MVTVNPVEASGPLTNPLMGFRPGLGNYSQYPYPTLIHVYIPWKTIENQESDSVQKIRDYCNAQWANLPSNNVKVIPRVYIDWDSNTGNEAWPSDLTTGDWSSQQFKDRVVRLVGRLGEVWNDDPRVAWVQTGIIGHWGEQESPVGIGQDGWEQRLGDAFTAAFPNKKFIVRNMGSWPAYDVGVYWDSFGHPGQRPWAWTDIINFNKQGRYLTEVVEGEVAYNWGIGGEFKDLYGGVWDPNANSGNGDWASSPDITLGNAQYTDNMIDVIRELHGSALGWIASYNPNDAIVRAQAARMQKEFGYRFHVNEFSCSARADPGANLDLQFKVENKGSAPFYENWPLAVVLVDKNTRRLLWKATIPNVDIRKWHPGADYSKTTRTYQTPAQEHLISASIPLPANLPVGEHLIGLTILEPLSRTPGLFFAIPNFFKQSQTQPLCKIGIGMNATGHILDGIVFDDLVGDDARSYTMTPQGPSYSLNLQTSSQGFISQTPGGGSHRKDSGLEVTAKGNLGYAFSSWGGALAGRTENPTIIVMDADKTISANYVSVPTYTLTTNATNGSVTLDPPGGVYNSGTVVTVTASPDNGFTFSHWSGDLAGSTSIATLIMEGDKGVSANFADFAGDRVPWMETFTLPNGTQADGPPSAWTATRSTGLFEVSNNRFMINGGSTEGVFETAEISIAGGSFRVSLEVQGEGGLDSGDYVRFYRIVDDGPPVLIGPEIAGAVPGTQTLVGTNINGSKLKLRVATKVTFSNEYYYFDNLAVEQEAPPTYTLATSATHGMIALNPPGGVYAAGSVVIVTATPNSGNNFDSWFGDFTGNTNPITVTMNGNKSVMANFSRSTLATIDSTGTTTVLDFDYPQNTYIGNGTLQVSTDGSVESEIHLGGGPNNTPTVFAMTGGLITIDNGASLVNGGWAKGIWTDNKADMLVNGTLDLWDGQAVRVNALNGAGSVEFGYPWGGGPRELDVGVEGGSGKFSGSIAGTHPYGNTFIHILKNGAGTQIFDNLANQNPRAIIINNGVVDLAAATDIVFTADISGGGNLRKSGVGLLTLTGSLNHTGSTTVNEGVLSIAQPAFAAGSTVTIGLAVASPAVLHLPDPGTYIIAQLIIDGVVQLGGGSVYDSMNSGGSISGSGKIQVGVAPIGYVAWEIIHGLIGGANDDDDKDGLTNFEEYAFGLLPTNSSSLNPIIVPFSRTTGTFSFIRRNSTLAGPLTYSVWYSTDLEAGSWTMDTGATEGTPVLAGDVETVPVTISTGLLVNPGLFIRVRAE